MNKDRVEGKVKDMAGRAERQVGEWTGNTESQVKGAAKQVEGKTQNAFGKAKDALKKSTRTAKPSPADETVDESVEEDESTDRRRRAS